MTIDQQEFRQRIGAVFAKREVLDACRHAHRDMSGVLAALRGHGVRQRLLADLTGVAQSRISEYATGRRRPSLDVLQRFADSLGLPGAACTALGLAS